MSDHFKPKDYNSVSPYFVVEDAQKLLELIQDLFAGELMRRYDNPDGTIMHAEVKIDDSILMMGNASENYPANKLLIHVYLPDVDKTFARAIELGCHSMEEPSERPGDPDRRGSFLDFAGNTWAIATQLSKLVK